MLGNLGKRKYISYINEVVVLGIKVCVVLVMEDWQIVLDVVNVVISKSGCSVGIGIVVIGGMNDVIVNNVMWVVEIIVDQFGMYVGFFIYMDVD